MLTMICGVPGSGKSTYVEKARKKDTVVICPDRIRKELTGAEEDQSKNKEVFELAYKRLRKALLSDTDVIFDATNLTKRARKSILDIAKGHNCEAVYFVVPLKTCLERNSKRERHVPEDVIRGMYKKYTYPKKEEGFSSVKRICA